MPAYFAYGSNMSPQVMARHCPDARPCGPALLRDWRFFVCAEGYGSVAPSPGGEVHGVLWEVSARDLVGLDAYEDVANGLYRRETTCVLHIRHETAALVYVTPSTQVGSPRPAYMALCLAAGRTWGLPADYLAELARWETA